MVNRRKTKQKAPKVVKRFCVRCHQLMGDEQTPWCNDCNTVLEGMTFTGREVLEMVVLMMPPTPPVPDATIKAYTVLKLSRAILIENDLLLLDPANPDDTKAKLLN